MVSAHNHYVFDRFRVFFQCHRPKNMLAAFILRFGDTLVIVCRTSSATLSANPMPFGRESMVHSVGSADTPLVKDSPLTLAAALTLWRSRRRYMAGLGQPLVCNDGWLSVAPSHQKNIEKSKKYVHWTQIFTILQILGHVVLLTLFTSCTKIYCYITIKTPQNYAKSNALDV